MALHKVIILPQNILFLLPNKSCLTNIENEPGGKYIIPFGCRIGSCGACVIKIIKGGEYLREKKNEEKDFLERLGYIDNNFRLACQCYLTGDVQITLI